MRLEEPPGSYRGALGVSEGHCGPVLFQELGIRRGASTPGRSSVMRWDMGTRGQEGPQPLNLVGQQLLVEL